ncbi:MAG: T9SS type A sorting domain-containing protein, partial [Bacteroidota bacterium]
VSFTRSVDVQLELVNLLGQVVWQGEQQRNVQQLQEQLDLSLLPNGVYLVRVRAGEQMISRRLIKG